MPLYNANKGAENRASLDHRALLNRCIDRLLHPFWLLLATLAVTTICAITVSHYFAGNTSAIKPAGLDPAITSSVIPSHAVVLLYHHVSDSTPAITSVTPKQFEQQLQFIEQNGFQVWPLPKIIKHLSNDLSLPDKTVAITFDDSYQSVFTEAFPRLQKRKWPFTIFVSTDAVDQQFKYHTSWDQLRTMAASGATIANHSTTHRHLLIRLKNESQLQWRQRIEQDIE